MNKYNHKRIKEKVNKSKSIIINPLEIKIKSIKNKINSLAINEFLY